MANNRHNNAIFLSCELMHQNIFDFFYAWLDLFTSLLRHCCTWYGQARLRWNWGIYSFPFPGVEVGCIVLLPGLSKCHTIFSRSVFLNWSIVEESVTSFCPSYLQTTRRRSRRAGSPGRRISERRCWKDQTPVSEVCLTERASTLRRQTTDQLRTLSTVRLVCTAQTPPWTSTTVESKLAKYIIFNSVIRCLQNTSFTKKARGVAVDQKCGVVWGWVYPLHTRNGVLSCIFVVGLFFKD